MCELTHATDNLKEGAWPGVLSHSRLNCSLLQKNIAFDLDDESNKMWNFGSAKEIGCYRERRACIDNYEEETTYL